MAGMHSMIQMQLHNPTSQNKLQKAKRRQEKCKKDNKKGSKEMSEKDGKKQGKKDYRTKKALEQSANYSTITKQRWPANSSKDSFL